MRTPLLSLLTIGFFAVISQESLADAEEKLFGIFDSPTCGQRIRDAIDAKGESYRAAAIAAGLTGPAIEEYVARKARSSGILSTDFVAALTEFGEIQKTLLYMGAGIEVRIELTELLGGKRISQREYERLHDSVVSEFRSMAEYKGQSERPMRERFPFSFSILLTRPPIGHYETDDFDDIVFLRSAMALYRARMGRAFLELPMDKPLNKLDQGLLEQANHAGTEKSSHEIMDVGRKTNCFGDQAKEIERELERCRVSKTDFAALAKTLMENKDIPLPVRQEISQQLNFEAKYHFSHNLFFRLYLVRVQRYFLRVEE